MIRRVHPITPSQAATNGAMDLFVDGHQRQRVPQMLIGLTVLASATEAQVQTAMRMVHAHRRLTLPAIEAMFTGN